MSGELGGVVSAEFTLPLPLLLLLLELTALELLRGGFRDGDHAVSSTASSSAARFPRLRKGLCILADSLRIIEGRLVSSFSLVDRRRGGPHACWLLVVFSKEVDMRAREGFVVIFRLNRDAMVKIG